MNIFKKIPVILSIAGSDNSGGAGIQADIKTSISLNIYPVTVITAVTAQNPDGLKNMRYVGDEMLISQLEATFQYFNPDAVKIGLIPNSVSIDLISDFLSSKNQKNIIVDPVLSATCGGNFFDNENDKKNKLLKLKEKLLPITDYFTPNTKEFFEIFGGTQIGKSELCLADSFTRMFPDIYLVLTGGDKDGDYCIDKIYNSASKNPLVLKSNKILSVNTHGTGCVFSTALACYVALGFQGIKAIKKAKEFTLEAIKRGKQFPVISSYGPVHPNCF